MSASEHPTPERELVALLACPFCGGEAHLIGKDGTYHGRAVVCVAGGGCTASLGEKYDRDGCDDHYFTSKQEAITAWNTRAATLPQAVSVPDGWVLVPREATSAMDWAGAEAAGEPFTGPDAERVWIAMIAAATTPPPAELGKGS